MAGVFKRARKARRAGLKKARTLGKKLAVGSVSDQLRKARIGKKKKILGTRF